MDARPAAVSIHLYKPLRHGLLPCCSSVCHATLPEVPDHVGFVAAVRILSDPTGSSALLPFFSEAYIMGL